MRTHSLRGLVLAVLLLALPNAAAVVAFERMTVTVRQLFDEKHRLEVPAGTEVAWVDPHFERVWLKPGRDTPKVDRMTGGFRATFPKPGTYHGAFTVTGGHATADVYDMTILVKPRPQ